jgi:ComF family protein
LGLRQIPKSIIDFLFPSRCLGCGRWGDFICESCFINLPRIVPPVCNKCGKPESTGGLCPACWNSHLVIDGIRSVFHFEGTVRKAIHHLKYYNLKAISKDLALVLYDYISHNELNSDIIIPVPLHRKRLRKRGYNQSFLVAKELGMLTSISVITDSLIRIKEGVPQAKTKGIEQRKENVHDAFVCRETHVKNKKVLLIDDVCTSGATLESCAIALKDVGATSIWGLTIAREI